MTNHHGEERLKNLALTLTLLLLAATLASAAPANAAKPLNANECVLRNIQKLKENRKATWSEKVVLSPATQARLNDSHPEHFTDSRGHQLFYQVVAPASPSGRTLLLLPGINRSLLLVDEPVRALAERGYGIVMLQYSTQPHSVVALKPEVRPHFLDQAVSLDDLTAEVTELADHLKRTGKKNLIPVSLSFSGSTSARLKGFQVAIDVVPMTSYAAANPGFQSVTSWFESTRWMNPFGTDWMQRNALDQAYRLHWEKEADSKIKAFGLRPSTKENIVQGYSAMSRAIEDFDWKNESPDKTARRLIVVAENDERSLLKNQIESFQRLKAQGYAVNLVIVQGAGHGVFSSHPNSYSFLIDRFLKKKGFASSVSVLDPLAHTLESVSAQDEDNLLSAYMNAPKN
jgi:pimeloyl-ACP methyl ester carboxylesterase